MVVVDGSRITLTSVFDLSEVASKRESTSFFNQAKYNYKIASDDQCNSLASGVTVYAVGVRNNSAFRSTCSLFFRSTNLAEQY